MIGQNISHYKILEKLGEGGMGVVYKAEDTKLKRTVALKFLSPVLTRESDAKARLIHEAQAAAALSHHNICTVYEIDEFKGQLFIAMECYEGETLADRIAKGPLPQNEAIDFAIQIAQGLAKAHEQGIVHRDIKPANIFITKDDQVKVVDFGLAKLSGQTRLTRTGTTLGTMSYMSPEQTMGENVDHRTDIWSWGVIFYEMLSGQVPFRGECEAAIMYSVVNEKLRPLKAIKPDIPEELAQIAAKTLEKKPNDRYENVEELIDDLYSISKGFVPPKIEAAILRAKLAARKRAYIFGGVAVLVALLTAAGLYHFVFRDRGIASIAVLPFKDLSPQKDQEYFCDGLADELINRLTNIEALRVPARTSSFSFKDGKTSIQEIGKKLNVSTVLEGSLRKAGDKIRISVALIKVADGYPLWSDKYEGSEEDIFAFQDQISLAIVENLMVKLTGEEQTTLGKHYTDDREAYNWYLKGRYHWNKRTEEDFYKALEYFQLAIEKDPTYGLAYAGIADCYNLLQVYAYLSPKEALPKARAAAENALELDPNLAEAHTSLAWVKWSYDYDWSAGEREFERALALNPNYSTGHHWYAIYLTAVGKHAESLAHIKRAQEIDPLSLMINVDVGFVLFYAREDDRAIEQYYKTVELDEDYLVSYWRLAMIYAQKEMYDEAFAASQNMKELLGEKAPLYLTTLGYIYSLSGKKEEAKKVLNQLMDLSKHRYISSLRIALIYMGLGQKDEAFQWLERAYEERDFWMALSKSAPPLDRLRSDPRFAMLLEKMNLE